MDMLNNQMVYCCWYIFNSPYEQWLLNPGWFSWGILLSYIYIWIIIIQERTEGF